jgi:acyl-CoA thioester hydrolase
MDAFQHVNNVVYARWLETARMVYLERIGLVDRMRDEGVGPILAKTTIDDKRPFKYPDTVHVSATITRIGGSSFTMSFRIRSEARPGEGTPLAPPTEAGEMANRSRGDLDERMAKGRK